MSLNPSTHNNSAVNNITPQNFNEVWEQYLGQPDRKSESFYNTYDQRRPVTRSIQNVHSLDGVFNGLNKKKLEKKKK